MSTLQQLTLEHVSPATRLLEKRRQMFEVQEALEAQKEEYKRREAEFKRREEKLKERDLALQESLIKFNKFLQENDSKRARAEKKERDEIKQRLAKEVEITKLRETLEKLKTDKAEMLSVLQKDMRYQTYLEAVLDSTDEYPEIIELLLRYETLEATHHDLVERSHEGQSESEGQSAFNKRFHKDKVDEILEYNNQIALLQQRYEASVVTSIRLQAETDRQLQDSAEATLLLGQVLMACDNIFTRCMSTSHVTRKQLSGDDDKDAAVEQLGVIRDYLGDLLFIVKNYKPPEARASAHESASAAALLADEQSTSVGYSGAGGERSTAGGHSGTTGQSGTTAKERSLGSKSNLRKSLSRTMSKGVDGPSGQSEPTSQGAEGSFKG